MFAIKPERSSLRTVLLVAGIALAALVAQTLWLERVVSDPIVSALVATQPTGRPQFYEDIEVRPPSRDRLPSQDRLVATGPAAGGVCIAE